MKSKFLAVLATLVLCAAARAGAVFKVTVDPAAAAGGPVSGRLVVSLIGEASSHAKEKPNDAPFWTDPQPMFAVNVKDAAPGAVIAVGDEADCTHAKASALAPGKYRAQARLITNRQTSSWERDAGNLFGPEASFEVTAGGDVSVDLTLNEVTQGKPWMNDAGLQLFEVKSRLLSDFHRREVILRAGVVFPSGYDAGKKYPAVYEVPGFGGDHFGAERVFKGRQNRAQLGRQAELDTGTFWIVLDPESPNGHTLFADSANNGPCGEALVRELIPALEAKFPLAATPEARILRGHSSGGWSTLWLAINYPGVFGATWASSPDPVDFRRYQASDIYSEKNLFTRTGSDGSAQEVASLREGGKVKMTVREEHSGERMLGEGFTSGQQWASWIAVWGPRAADGRPRACYDERTGAIDHAAAERYRKYDIGHLVRTSPERYAKPLLTSVRLVVGDQDSFYLNEAVALLKEDVAKAAAKLNESVEGPTHYIKIVPGRDHGTVLSSPEGRAIPQEMTTYLNSAGLHPWNAPR